ncbi:unnamed protein product [Phytomonas sp. EM1]|nr:unnamed protein product [Phytomonas sp. EM1]|eukprot:CCW60591.1 unnamed protein product [Phytomonas sp. isolate EM1]
MKRCLIATWFSNSVWLAAKSPSEVVRLNNAFFLFSRRHICVNAIRLGATQPLRYPTSVDGDHGIEKRDASSTPFPGINTPNVEKPAVQLVEEQRVALGNAFDALLENRQASYRDTVVIDALQPHRMEIKRLLLDLAKGTHSHDLNELFSSNPSTNGKECVLTVHHISLLKDIWLQRHEGGGSGNDRRRDIYRFYSLLLSSALVTSNAEVRLVLDEMLANDGLPPNHEIYESIMRSLLVINVGLTSSIEAAGNTTEGDKPRQFILGQPCVLDRATSGDLAGRYMGHALAQISKNNPNLPSGAAVRENDTDYLPLWGDFMELCALTDVAPALMDLWWKKLCDFCDPVGPPHETENPLDVAPTTIAAEATPLPRAFKGSLPYRGVYAALAWCVRNHDLERCLRYFHEANARGLTGDYPASTGVHGDVAFSLRSPGSLTRRSVDPAIQRLQLRLLVKLMATVKSIPMDGGVKNLVVADVQRLIDAAVLFHAPWGVINDFLSGLSVRSAMRLVRRCASVHPTGDAAVPFSVWASLLRRCARAHHLDEANSLFLFLRKRFALTGGEKRELVEIVMRMYATLPTPDFASTMSIFLEHVRRTPKGEPAVAADRGLYNLLIQAADSRNAAMMVFLEAAAAGVGMDFATFETLLGGHPFRGVAGLSRRLPHDYASTRFDAQLRIPADADAHLRREEARRARGKAIYDSTGDTS